MAMKKIKPQYGKVIAPITAAQEKKDDSVIGINSIVEEDIVALMVDSSENIQNEPEGKPAKSNSEKPSSGNRSTITETEKSSAKITSEPNPFMQTKEIFGKARLTKIGYRMRTDYVEILDIIKKMKKGGYTLEAVLDDALTFYFENSEDGREAIRKAEIFYS